MSTPTAAVAAVHRYPHYSHPNPRPSYGRHRPGGAGASATHVTPTATTTTTTTSAAPAASIPTPTTAAATPPSSSTVGRPFHFLQPTNGAYGSLSDGIAPRSSAPRQSPDAYHHRNLDEYAPGRTAKQQPYRHDDHYAGSMTDLPPKKRRRSHEPDWQEFYRNGLPNEVIVIDDDSPEPDAGRGHVSGNGPAAAANATTRTVNIANTTAVRQPPKKRRREDDPNAARHPGYHIQYADSHNNTPAGSSIPNDFTSSDPHTTAPTSLSSNSQYDSTIPLKRKRTRQQAAIEAKRRHVDVLENRCLTYKPPPFPPKKASEVKVRTANDPPHQKNTKIDDDDGHYIVVPDASLTERYQITRLLGQGTFGKVVEAHDGRRGEAVAVKIIRSVQKYRDASRIELRVLATLKANDEENRNRCIHLRDCFDYRGHICLVMDLLDQSIFDFLKGNGFVPFPNSQIQSFARQLFTSVAFLHNINLVHTDLKPENILLCNNNYQTFTYSRRIPSSSTTINRTATQRRVLLDTEIRLIDFGSATFDDEYHSSVVSTRHYRAPEIILGLGWSFPCDIWSIGCILVELFTGDALFQTHDNLEHLAMMEAVIGKRIDSHLVQQVNKNSGRNSSNSASSYFKRLKLNYPAADTTRGSRRFVKAMKHLDDVIPQSNTFMTSFLDLLKRIFVYDPKMRITAEEALNHEWFKEVATNDDGTEAAKIRLERLMKDDHDLYYT